MVPGSSSCRGNAMTAPYEMNRRAFITTTAAATATAAIAPSARALDAPADGLIHRNERSGMHYRKLGRTNFMCSHLVFGCGAALIGGKAVRLLNAAFDAGDRKSTRLNSSHVSQSRMPSSA